KRDHRAIENSVSTNHVWRERKETTRAIFRQNPTTHPVACIKVAVAGERAQFSYYVVFSAVVALRCSRGWVPARTASSGMLLVKPFLSSIVVEAQ
ncbi:hypothetical protein T05_5102, partial [Trichinella murrelli]